MDNNFRDTITSLVDRAQQLENLAADLTREVKQLHVAGRGWPTATLITTPRRSYRELVRTECTRSVLAGEAIDPTAIHRKLGEITGIQHTRKMVCEWKKLVGEIGLH